MKKNLLFVIPTLDLGGAEKSLLNLLHAIDKEKYNVDLFCFVKRGVFLDSLPKDINMINNSRLYRIFSKSLFVSIPLLFFTGRWRLSFLRFLFALKYRLVKNIAINEQVTWKYTKEFFPELEKKYNVAIGYLEKSAYYFVADKVIAQKKIGWIHTDLEALDLDFEFEEKYFNKLDALVTVSEGLQKRLGQKLPSIKNKIYTIENINFKNSIIHLSHQIIPTKLESNFFNVIFVGRLVKEKGLFMAIDAIEILVKKNLKIKLCLVGEGNLKNELIKYAKQKNLENNIIFLGVQSNPYPLISQANVFLMSSFYEGKSIALEEAKILHKPIVITNFSSAKDQIKDNETGLIADMNAESIAEKLQYLYNDRALQEKLISHLKKEKLGNENEVEKLYQLINL